MKLSGTCGQSGRTIPTAESGLFFNSVEVLRRSVSGCYVNQSSCGAGLSGCVHVQMYSLAASRCPGLALNVHFKTPSRSRQRKRRLTV